MRVATTERGEPTGSRFWAFAFFLAVFGVAVATFALYWLVGDYRAWSLDQQRALPETQALGDQIVTELRRFKAEHGAFPESLGEVKNFDVPQPTWGAKCWKYSRLEDGRFQLQVRKYSESAGPTAYESLFYIGAEDSGHWSLDQ